MIYFISIIVYGLIFGFITGSVAKSKGYDDGFLWGFFLGIIGLLVVGFRPDNRQAANNTSTSYVDSFAQSSQRQQTGIKQSESQEPIENNWICIECGAENQHAAKFCYKCGEKRHYKWKCGKCGENNGENVRFCANCGKQKEDSEEINPNVLLETVLKDDLETILKNDSLKEELRKKLQGEARESLIYRIDRDGYTWMEPERLGEFGTLYKGLGLTKKKQEYAPEGISDREAKEQGYSSWTLEGDKKRYFFAVPKVPDVPIDKMQEYIAEVLQRVKK